MKIKIPKKVLNCKKHSACDCMKWKLDELETLAKIIYTWCNFENNRFISIDEIRKYCDEKLEAIKIIDNIAQ